MSAIDDFLSKNAAHAEGFSGGGAAAPPVKKIAVVACMDARLDTAALLGLRSGDAHVLRNGGGVITDDVIRSLMLSQRLLGTREVMLIHHTRCGLLGLGGEELKDQIECETGTRPPFDIGGFADLDGSVRASIARIQASPFLPYRDAVRGFVYDIDTGRLREVLP